MVDLPKIPKRSDLTPQVTSSVGAGDYASIGRAWSGALHSVSQGIDTFGEPLAQEAGRNAVTRDEQGNLKVEMPPIVGRLGDVARKSAEMAFTVQAQGEIEKNLTDLHNKTWKPVSEGGGGGDPSWFEKAAGSFINAFAGQHRGGFQGVVKQMGARVASQHTVNLMNQRERLDIKNQNDVLKGREEELRSRLATLAFDSGTDSDEFRSTVEELKSIRGQRSGDPRFGYSTAEAGLDAERDARTMRGMAVVGQARRDYQSTGDLAGAQRRAEEALTAAGIPIDERGRMIGEISSHLSGMAAVRAVQKQEFKDKALELGQRLQLGERLDEGEILRLATDMEKFGMFSDARKLRIDHAVNIGTADTSSGSAGDRVAGLKRARDSAAGAGFPSSLIGTESGGNWKAQNSVAGAGGMVGHFGRLQFGHARLQEARAAGAMPAGASVQDFLNSPEMQRNVERWHFSDIDQYIKDNGLSGAIGKTINGVVVTQDGMRAVAHLGGKDGLRRFIQSNGSYNPADANGTSLTTYLGKHSGNTAGGTGYSIVTQARLIAAQRAFDSSAKAELKTFKDSFDLVSGPTPEQAKSLMTIAPDISDEKVRQEVLDVLDKNRARLAVLTDPKAVDEAIAGIKLAATTEGASKREQKFAGYLEEHRKAQDKELESKPYLHGTRMQWDGEAAPTTMKAAAVPLDFGNAATLRAQIDARSTGSQLLEARFGRTATSLIDSEDAQKLKGVGPQLDAQGITAVFSSLAAARREPLAVTLKDKEAREALVSLTKTTDPVKFNAAMSGLDMLMRRDERGFVDAMDGDTLEKLMKWRDNIGLYNDPKQIEKLINPAMRGKEDDVAKAMRAKGERIGREMEDKDLQGIFRSFAKRFVGGNPDAFVEPGPGQDSAVNLPQNALRADLASTIGDFMASGMSEDRAKEAAFTKIQKTWGVSGVNDQIMKHAPDRFYMKHFGFTAREMDEEVQGALREATGKPLNKVMAALAPQSQRFKYLMVPNATTQADIKAWQDWEAQGSKGPAPAPPRYQILFEDTTKNPPQLRMVEGENGSPRLFRWDTAKKQAAYAKEFNDRRAAMDAADALSMQFFGVP